MAPVRFATFATIAAEGPAVDGVVVAMPPRGELIPGGKAVPSTLVGFAVRSTLGESAARREKGQLLQGPV